MNAIGTVRSTAFIRNPYPVEPSDVVVATDEHFARIHRAALVLTGNPWDADDLAQETFLVLARSSQSFAGRSRLYTWLYGILLNLDRRRQRQRATDRRKLRVLWNNEPARPTTAPPASTTAETAEWQRSLWSLVAKLPDSQRAALVLRYAEHLSYEEIAEVLECPLGTVKSRIFNGLAALRALCLDDETTSPDDLPISTIQLNREHAARRTHGL